MTDSRLSPIYDDSIMFRMKCTSKSYKVLQFFNNIDNLIIHLLLGQYLLVLHDFEIDNNKIKNSCKNVLFIFKTV